MSLDMIDQSTMPIIVLSELCDAFFEGLGQMHNLFASKSLRNWQVGSIHLQVVFLMYVPFK